MHENCLPKCHLYNTQKGGPHVMHDFADSGFTRWMKGSICPSKKVSNTVPESEVSEGYYNVYNKPDKLLIDFGLKELLMIHLKRTQSNFSKLLAAWKSYGKTK